MPNKPSTSSQKKFGNLPVKREKEPRPKTQLEELHEEACVAEQVQLELKAQFYARHAQKPRDIGGS